MTSHCLFLLCFHWYLNKHTWESKVEINELTLDAFIEVCI